MKTNSKPTAYAEGTLPGGAHGAKENAEMLLRRAVMANLLWEDLFYENGVSVVDNIKKLIPQVDPATLSKIAIEARTEQKLRHVPLLLVREMARLPKCRPYVAGTLESVIKRADELTEFLAIYWKEGKQPISNQVKIGLANAFGKFNEYQLAKYNRPNEIKLRDVLRLVHPKPANKEQEDLWGRLLKDGLKTPDTWETELSAGKDKAETFTRLIQERKLGGLAFVRNLRNMISSGVKDKVILEGFQTVNAEWLLPIDFLKAAEYAPQYIREIEALMFKSFTNAPKLKGLTVMVVDESGSMGARISGKSEMSRMDAAFAMAVMAEGMCERLACYATAGDDWKRTHKTVRVKPYRGFALKEELQKMVRTMGGGGIFTRQCLEYIKEDLKGETPERIIIFSDSQDCDLPGKTIPAPFGKYNYICDVSAHQLGVNYTGVWDAEIAGWSESFLKYIAAYEGNSVSLQEE